MDFIASFAALVGAPLSDRRAHDSENVLPALLGTSKTGRAVLVEQAVSLSLRQGTWKYIAPSQGPRINSNTRTELGNDSQPQLYDLAADQGERNNLATTHPEKVRELAALLDGIRRAHGQSATTRRPSGGPRRLAPGRAAYRHATSDSDLHAWQTSRTITSAIRSDFRIIVCWCLLIVVARQVRLHHIVLIMA